MTVANPGTWDFTIYQGSKFEKTITYPDRDLTGGTFRMQIRKSPGSDTLIAEFTTADGHFSAALSGSDTVITMTILATETDDLSFETAKYDIEYVPASGEDDVERILQGTVTLDDEVTVPTS